MSIKEMFLKYVESQRSAIDQLMILGPDDPRTVAAFDRANRLKRRVLDEIEDIEWRMGGLEK